MNTTARLNSTYLSLTSGKCISALIVFFIAVALKAQPVITQQPTNQVVINGGTTVFSVAVSGTGPFSYQWQFNGTNMPFNIITTFAGNGTPSYAGDGGAATNAELFHPAGVAVDYAGNLFIADCANERIRKVSANGIISTVAGNGTWGYDGDGNYATIAKLNHPYGVALNGAGNIFIADTDNNRIRMVNSSKTITTVAGNEINGWNGDGYGANVELNGPTGVATDSSGNLFIADVNNLMVRKLNTGGYVSTLAGNLTSGYSGDGGPATSAGLYYPNAVAVDNLGNVLISDGYRIRKIGTNGVIMTIAGSLVSGYSGDGGAATNAEISWPSGIVCDNVGNIFIADTGNNCIRRISANGIIATIAGNGTNGFSGDGGSSQNAELSNPCGISMDGNGNLYVADQGNSLIRKISGLKYSNPTLVLTNLSTNSIGCYSVIIVNPSGSITSSVASLTMPPFLVTQPQGGNVWLDHSWGFSVTAGNIGPFNYQWTFNGTNIVEATNSSYLVTSMSTNDVGIYAVSITNNYGSVASTGAVLSVDFISQQPANQIATNGGIATFGVAASGPGSFAYQWLFKGTNLPSATSSNLTLTSVNTNKIGSYSVVITNISGSVTSSAASLNMPAFIVTQTQSWTALLGGTARFGITAGSTAPFGYQWAVNGTNILGATNSSYSMSNLATTNAGIYTVAVSNSYGGIVSTGSVLSVAFIRQPPADQVVTNGGTASFGVGLSSPGSFNYQWLFNGTNLPSATSATLTLNNVSTNKIGSYAVVVTNSSGSITSSVAALNMPVFIVTQPPDQTVLLTGTANFSCPAAGSLPLNYQWAFNGTNIAIGTNASYAVSNVSTNNAGIYTANVTNAYGGVASRSAVLTVAYISQQPTNQTVAVGGTAGFAARLSNGGPFTYQWLFNGTNLTSATSTNLTISGVTPGNLGNYAMVVTGSGTSITSSVAVLTVVPAIITQQPQSLTVKTSDNATFSVTASGLSLNYQWYFINTNLQTVAGAVAQIYNGFVYGANVTNGGSGYTTAPQVQFSGGGGAGAAASAVVSNGMVAAVNVSSTGLGYTNPPAIQIDPPNGLLIGQTASTLNLSGINLTNVGAYFVVISNNYGCVTSSLAYLSIGNPSIVQQPQPEYAGMGGNASFNVIVGGATPFNYQWWMTASQQSNATAIPTVVNGFVLGAVITSGGAGYLAIPSVQFVGGSGSGAGGNAVVSNRMVTAITMTNAGSGYNTPPTIQIAAPTAICLTGQNNSVLAWLAVANTNAGNYFVVVTNNYGSVTSILASLTVALPGYNQISSPVLNNGQMSLSFVGIGGGNYALDRSFSLSPANWIPQITNPADANGNLIFTNTPDATTNNFWRIRSVP